MGTIHEIYAGVNYPLLLTLPLFYNVGSTWFNMVKPSNTREKDGSMMWVHRIVNECV